MASTSHHPPALSHRNQTLPTSPSLSVLTSPDSSSGMASKKFGWFGRGSSSSTTPMPMAADNMMGGPMMVEEKMESGPVLVELFTSQGCSSCPPADQLMTKLGSEDFCRQNGLPPVVILEFHVDYWDYLGWKDPFSANVWTARQRSYSGALRLDSLYTPQAVAQGRAQCVGSNQKSVVSAIRSVPRFPSPTFQISFYKQSADTLQLSLSGQLGSKVDGSGVDVMVALYENGLVTNCPRGENRGCVLSNDHVVRGFTRLCNVRDASADMTISGNVSFSLWKGFDSTKSGLVVFVQNSSFQVFGVQLIHLPFMA